MTQVLANNPIEPIEPSARTRADGWMALALGLLTALLFARSFTFGYIEYDDQVYAQEQRHVLTGFSLQNIAWSFKTFDGGNWHPLTWWSMMLDVEIFGPTPTAFHVGNTLQHAGSTVLVFFLLRRLGATRWPSAIAAAAFGWHPLRAESVVWISERKDTLCVVLILITLHVFLTYARSGSRKMYALLLVCLTAALASKAMAVSLPPIMLMLTYWPLGARTRGAWGKALRDQILPVLIVIAFCAVTIHAQKDQRALAGNEFAIEVRIANAINSYVTYVRQTFVPTGLGFFYPHDRIVAPENLDRAVTLPKLIGLACATGMFVLIRRRVPHALVGWLFFGITFVPVIGIVQVGSQGHADRYTYLPHVGLCILFAVELSRHDGSLRRAFWPTFRVAFVLLVGWWTVLGYRQIGYWRNTEALAEHTVRVVSDSYTAKALLASKLARTGRQIEALTLAREAVSDFPNDSFSWSVLSLVYDELELNDQALRAIRMAGLCDRQSLDMWQQYARLLVKTEDRKTAVDALKRAMQIRPDDPSLMASLALLHAEMGQYDLAFPLWDAAISLRPDVSSFRFGRGLAWVVTGRTRDGIAELYEAIRLDPLDSEAPMRLAWVLATIADVRYQNPSESLRLIRISLNLSTRRSATRQSKYAVDRLDTYAAALARNGEFAEAVDVARRAQALALQERKEPLAGRIGERLRLYEQSKPFPPELRTTAPANPVISTPSDVSDGH